MAKTPSYVARARDAWTARNKDYNLYIQKRSVTRYFAKRTPGTRFDQILDAGDSRIDYIQDLMDMQELCREAIEREKGCKEVQRTVLAFDSDDDKKLLEELQKSAKRERLTLSEYVKKALKSVEKA